MADGIVCQSGIYAITNDVNGKKYIGSAIDIRARWRQHKSKLRLGKHANKKLQASWNKHGHDVFVFSVLEIVEDKACLINREQAWIDALNAHGANGYNLRAFAQSQLGFKHSEETKALMKLVRTGRKNSPEHIENSRRANTGKKQSPEHLENNRRSKIGKKATEETKAKMSAARIGFKHSDATKAKMAGRIFSPSTRQKLSDALSGRVISPEWREKLRAASLGKSHSAESRAKMSEARKGIKQSPELVAKRMAAIAAGRLARALQRP